MTWQEERRWGQAWTVLAVFALLMAIFGGLNDLGQVLLVILCMVALGAASGHGYRALQKEAEEKGWPRG